MGYFDNDPRFKGYQKNKYHNVKWEMDGEKYDSQKEARRHAELKLLERAGEISNLRRQVPYELIPNQYNGKKLIERKVEYIADFVYHDNKTGEDVVEDTKSKATKTPVYIVKRKLLLFRYGIKIKEV